MLFEERLSYEVVEVDSDAHLELNEKGKVIGIEIWNARNRSLIEWGAKAVAYSLVC